MSKRKNPVVLSTRKIERNKLRRVAEINGVKASRYVNREFDRKQTEKYGAAVRTVNCAKGTHKRSKWRERISAVM